MTEFSENDEEVVSQPLDHPLLKTVIVSRPGISQEALRTGLAEFAWVDIVGSATNGLSALSLLEYQRPNLLIIDSNLLDDEVVHLIQYAKKEDPTLSCLVLTQTYHRQRAALETGADAVLQRDSSAQKLQQVLLQFLPESPVNSAESDPG